MAVQNKYVNADLVAATQKTTAAGTAQGSETFALRQTFEVAAADDDGSIYRIFKGLPSTLIPKTMRISCDALTGSTAWDVGLYKTDLGDEVDANVLGSALNLSAGYSRILGLDGLAAVDLADCNKMLWELAGRTILNRENSYDIALTATTVGSGAGTVTVIAEFFRN